MLILASSSHVASVSVSRQAQILEEDARIGPAHGDVHAQVYPKLQENLCHTLCMQPASSARFVSQGVAASAASVLASWQ